MCLAEIVYKSKKKKTLTFQGMGDNTDSCHGNAAENALFYMSHMKKKKS